MMSTLPVSSRIPKTTSTDPPTRSIHRSRLRTRATTSVIRPKARPLRRNGTPRPERVGQQQGDPSGRRSPGAGGQREHAAEHRPDARGPGEGEGHAHHRGAQAPSTEGRTRNRRSPDRAMGRVTPSGHGHQHGAEDHDEDPRHRLQGPLVGEEQAARWPMPTPRGW